MLIVADFSYTIAIKELDKNKCKENFAKEPCFKACGAKIRGSNIILKITLPQAAVVASFNYPIVFDRNSNNVLYNFSNQFIT